MKILMKKLLNKYSKLKIILNLFFDEKDGDIKLILIVIIYLLNKKNILIVNN